MTPHDKASAPTAAQSFRDWAQAKPLSEALSRAEAGVRARPQHPGTRWFLFELLCVLGQWERALKQLQVWAALSQGTEPTAQVYRGLVRAERQRVEVFAGRRAPALVPLPEPGPQPHGAPSAGEAAGGAMIAGAVEAGLPPAALNSKWIAGMADALRLAAEPGEASLAASDLAREVALAKAPETPGRGNLPPAFDWITDADSRVGPSCEVVLVGAYRWLPFDEVASLRMPAPTGLLDLVWRQVEIELRDGAALKGYMPMRYPLDEHGVPPRDALLMGRETVWRDVGRTGVHGQGQKMWSTSAGDMALLDVRECNFDPASPVPASQDGADDAAP